MKDFDVIYQHFQPKIRRYLTNLAGEDDAADLTQAVFLKVSRSLEGFREESSLATWIYRIATNTAHDHAASSAVQQKTCVQGLDDAVSVDDLPDSRSPATDSAYIRREMSACIRGVIGELPETYRTVLLLSEFEELPDREIAEVVGATIETVKVRLHRARTALRKALQSQCSLYHDERSELMCDRKPE